MKPWAFAEQRQAKLFLPAIVFTAIVLALVGGILGLTFSSLSLSHWFSKYTWGYCFPTKITKEVTKSTCSREECNYITVPMTTIDANGNPSITYTTQCQSYTVYYDCFDFWLGWLHC